MSASLDAKVLREIKIKTGVVKRLLKDKISYEKEAAEIQTKVDQMRASNEDDYLIKKQEELLTESKTMVSDCEGRFIAAWKELSKLIEQERDSEQTEEYKAAVSVLEESKSSVH